MHFLAQFTALYRVVGLKKDMIKFSVTTYLRNATRSFLDGLIAGVFRSLSLILEKWLVKPINEGYASTCHDVSYACKREAVIKEIIIKVK